MPRKPKPKNTLSAGMRVALQEEELRRKMSADVGENNVGDDVSRDDIDNVQKENTMPEGSTGERSGNIDGVRTFEAREKKKEKPKSAIVKVDFDIETEAVAKLHGVCNGPLCGVADISKLFSDAHVPYVRFDKTGGSRSGYVADISKIFPNFDADERNPKNYFFRETDEHILAAKNSGAEIIYRLGESFDVQTPERLLKFSDNYDKIVSICVNIIKHYNDYWGGGFALGIKYFEVFSHVDSESVRRHNSDTEIFELYTRIANGIKIYDESINVGGLCFSSPSQFCRDFIRHCEKKNAPMDFLSVAIYTHSPESIGEYIERYLRLLKNSKYSNSNIIIGEWAYLAQRDEKPSSEIIINSRSSETSQARKDLFELQRSVCGASFIASGLTKMLEYPEVSHACLYSGEADCRWCCICDEFGIPRKAYFALEKFGLVSNGQSGVLCTSEQSANYRHTGIYAVASRSEKEAYILISAFDGAESVDLRLLNIPDNFYTADIYMLDGVKNMDLCQSVQLAGMKKRMILNISPYSVIFIKLY